LYELLDDLGIAFSAPLRPSVLDRNSSTVNPPVVTEPLDKCGTPAGHDCGRAGTKKTDGRQLAGLLSVRGNRPESRHAGKEGNKLSTPHERSNSFILAS
jgi:hypothetical protein